MSTGAAPAGVAKFRPCVLLLTCGGPTPVWNSTIVGILRGSDPITVYGGRHGYEALVSRNLIDLTPLRDEYRLRIMAKQHGSVLGGGRFRLTDETMPSALKTLELYNVGILIVIGGNGTMAGALALQKAALANQQSLTIIGVPKTVDNDLNGTYFAPGFPTAANTVASATRSIALDLHTMSHFDDVTVVEMMGRHAGWLTAATSFASSSGYTKRATVNRKRRADESAPQNAHDQIAEATLEQQRRARELGTNQPPFKAPDMLLLPEVPFDQDAFLARIKAIHAKKGTCLIVASEGIQTAAGKYVAELGSSSASQDASGQALLSLSAGVAPYLAGLIKGKLGLRCRQIRPDVMSRSICTSTSGIDHRLAYEAGNTAGLNAKRLVETETHETPTFVAIDYKGDNKFAITVVPLSPAVVQGEKKMPASYIDKNNFWVTTAFLDYMQPLMDALVDPIML